MTVSCLSPDILAGRALIGVAPLLLSYNITLPKDQYLKLTLEFQDNILAYDIVNKNK